MIYGLEFLWLFIPLMVSWPLSVGLPIVDQAIQTSIDGLTASGPIGPGRQFFFAAFSGGGPVLDSLITMIELHTWRASSLPRGGLAASTGLQGSGGSRHHEMLDLRLADQKPPSTALGPSSPG